MKVDRFMRNERGFSLVELIAVLALMAIIFSLGAVAIRSFWLKRTLISAQDEVVTQLRATQQRVVSESHPRVYGVRFKEGTPDWAVVAYDPMAGTCSEVGQRTLRGGVQFDAGTAFSPDYLDGATNVTSLCRGDATDVVFFFARGTAVAGQVSLTQPAVNQSRGACVTAITARVVAREGASC